MNATKATKVHRNGTLTKQAKPKSRKSAAKQTVVYEKQPGYRPTQFLVTTGIYEQFRTAWENATLGQILSEAIEDLEDRRKLAIEQDRFAEFVASTDDQVVWHGGRAVALIRVDQEGHAQVVTLDWRDDDQAAPGTEEVREATPVTPHVGLTEIMGQPFRVEFWTNAQWFRAGRPARDARFLGGVGMFRLVWIAGEAVKSNHNDWYKQWAEHCAAQHAKGVPNDQG
jgi:hypothetical protein